MIIIGSYHKTGTYLLYNIFNELCNISKNKECIMFNSHFNEITDEQIKNNKCVIIIRNPYEVICSSMRYHQIADEL